MICRERGFFTLGTASSSGEATIQRGANVKCGFACGLNALEATAATRTGKNADFREPFTQNQPETPAVT
jgi:hypothetical protein